MSTDDMRVQVLTHYGNGRCACVQCGFENITALCIDHIMNDGQHHRKTMKANIYTWLVKNDLPDGFQTLCMNCNWIKYRQEGPPNPRKKTQREYPVMDEPYRDWKLPKRLRRLLTLSDTVPFRAADIRAILPMTAAESRNLRVLLHRMAQKGELERVEGRPRWYCKTDRFNSVYSYPAKVC